MTFDIGSTTAVIRLKEARLQSETSIPLQQLITTIWRHNEEVVACRRQVRESVCILEPMLDLSFGANEVNSGFKSSPFYEVLETLVPLTDLPGILHARDRFAKSTLTILIQKPQKCRRIGTPSKARSSSAKK